ncbi:MAG: CARDB domain-containing protein [Candidatus Buchananbacteria bacterium]
MKKIFLILVAVFTVIVISGQPAQAAYLPMAGDLVKTAASPAVYIIDDDLKRHLFSNQATFFTWYSGGWSEQKIKVITQDEFDQLDNGKNVMVRPGSNLVRFDNSNKVFAVTPGGVLCEVRALYGDNWQARVVVIQSSFETDYIRDNSCILTSASKLPDGSLIKYAKSNDVYLIDDGKKRKVTTDGFKANGYKDSSVISNVPTTMVYTSGKTSVTAAERGLSILYSLVYNLAVTSPTNPDLVIYDIIFPVSQPQVNTNYNVVLQIKNTGSALTGSAGLRNVSFIGQDFTIATINHGDYPSVSRPLGTSQIFEITYSGKFIASGKKTFTVKVDEPSELSEVNENNNTYSEDITVVQ